MLRENVFTVMLARLARVPFALFRQRPFTPPAKALILHPCCLSQVLLSTPLLAALSETYPRGRFDWAVSDWARPAIAGNPRLTELISAGPGRPHDLSWRELNAFIDRLRAEKYDTCFIPSRSTLLAYVAWRAGIPQRVGLNIDGRGFAHTLAVRLPPEGAHDTAVALLLAAAAGVDPAVIQSASTEFYPPDRDRTAVTQRLVEEIDWLGDVPLVVMHPGGGSNPVATDLRKQWPVERFARLGNHLARRHGARVALVGSEADRPLAAAIGGLMAVKATNLAGQMGLGELGALCEVADLYVGNDAGPTHVAAATGCPTLAIYGPSDPAVSGPHAPQGKVRALWRRFEGEFSWSAGVTVAEAIAAAEELLRRAG
jgi:heptosyltransferase II